MNTKPNRDITAGIENLAKAMAYKACEKKDIQTTAEGRSMLKHTYKVAHTMLGEVVERYLKAI